MAGVQALVVVHPGRARQVIPAAAVRPDFGGAVSIPLQEHLEDHHGLAVDLEALRRQGCLDFAAHGIRRVAAVGLHRAPPPNQVDSQPPAVVPVKPEGDRPIAGARHAVSIKPLDLGHHSVQPLLVAGERLAVAGDEVGDTNGRDGGLGPNVRRNYRQQHGRQGDWALRLLWTRPW